MYLQPEKRIDTRYSHHIAKINDGDILSYYQSLRREGEAVEVEFARSVSVDSIVYIPRNDDNFVWPGGRYELLYNNGGGGMYLLAARLPVAILSLLMGFQAVRYYGSGI